MLKPLPLAPPSRPETFPPNGELKDSTNRHRPQEVQVVNAADHGELDDAVARSRPLSRVRRRHWQRQTRPHRTEPARPVPVAMVKSGLENRHKDDMITDAERRLQREDQQPLTTPGSVAVWSTAELKATVTGPILEDSLNPTHDRPLAMSAGASTCSVSEKGSTAPIETPLHEPGAVGIDRWDLPAGSRKTKRVRARIPDGTRRGAARCGEKGSRKYQKAVQALVGPGEASNGYAMAMAVVLASRSFRFGASRCDRHTSDMDCRRTGCDT